MSHRHSPSLPPSARSRLAHSPSPSGRTLARAAEADSSKITKEGAAAMMSAGGTASATTSARGSRRSSKNYLIAHPEIIRDAITELQRREDTAAASSRPRRCIQQDLLFDSPREIVFGNAEGRCHPGSSLDHNCTYCRRARPT